MKYPHLLDTVQDIAEKGDETRIRCILEDHWIGYPRAEQILQEIDSLLHHPRRTRMPNLLIYGPTNNGKTTIVKECVRLHPRSSKDGVSHVPICLVEMPPSPETRWFFALILKELGIRFPASRSTVAHQDEAMRKLEEVGTEMLIVDEIHNALSGNIRKTREFLNLLRFIGNSLKIPVVALGVHEAAQVMQADDQTANRFTPMSVPPWSHDEEFLTLLDTLECIMPLKKASNLSDQLIANEIYSLSEGLLGEVTMIVARSAVAAIKTGKERINRSLIRNLGVVRPSRRRFLQDPRASG